MATYKTLVLDVETVQGGSLAGATVYVSYDRTVRLSSGGIVPDPASNGVAVPVVGTSSVQVLASDDPDLTVDSAGFGISVRIVWTEAPSWRPQSKTYVAQVHVADAATVNLSDHLATVATSGVTVLQGPKGNTGDTGPQGVPGAPGSVANDSTTAGFVGSQSSASSTSAALAAREKSRGHVNVLDYLPSNWASLTDLTTYFSNALTAAAAANSSVVDVPQGLYPVSGLVIPSGTGLRGTQSSKSDYGTVTNYDAVCLTRVSGDSSTNAIVALNGAGCVLKDLEIRGAYTVTSGDAHGAYTGGAPTGDNGPGLYVSGFQTHIENVFIHGVSHAGLWVDAECDPHWSKIEVNVCGNATIPAIAIGYGRNGDNTGSGTGYHFLPSGVSQVTLSSDTNTLIIDKLVAQGNFAGVLDVGNLVADGTCEEVMFTNAHLEGNLGSHVVASPKPVVKVGSYARGTKFRTGYIYGGKSPSGSTSAPSLVEFNSTLPVTYTQSGTASTVPAPPSSGALSWLPYGLSFEGIDFLGDRGGIVHTTTACNLIAGDGFHISNCRFDWVYGPSVTIGSGFGANVSIGNGLFNVNQSAAYAVVSDARSNRTGGMVSPSNLTVQGKLIFGRQAGVGLPTVAVNANAGTGAGSATVTNGSDNGANVGWTSGTASLAGGVQATVTFNQPFNTAPYVFITPLTAAAGTTGAYAYNFSATSFDITFPSAPAASTHYAFAWFAYTYR